MGYYRNPQPEAVGDMLAALDRDPAFRQNRSAAMPTAGFLAGVFMAHPERVAEWASRSAELGAEIRRTVWFALWLADTAATRQYLRQRQEAAAGADREYLAKLTQRWPGSLAKLRPTHPGQVDMLWGAFFSSGDGDYVRGIVSILPLLEDRENALRFAMGAAAKWSLKSNGRRHPRVLEVCRAEAAAAKGAMRRILDEIVEDAETGSAEDDTDDDVRVLKEEFPH
jgi:hypothetical protein